MHPKVAFGSKWTSVSLFGIWNHYMGAGTGRACSLVSLPASDTAMGREAICVHASPFTQHLLHQHSSMCTHSKTTLLLATRAQSPVCTRGRTLASESIQWTESWVRFFLKISSIQYFFHWLTPLLMGKTLLLHDPLKHPSRANHRLSWQQVAKKNLESLCLPWPLSYWHVGD